MSDDLKAIREIPGCGEHRMAQDGIENWRCFNCWGLLRNGIARACLEAAVPELMRDRERLEKLLHWFDMMDDFEGSGLRDWDDHDDARRAIDEAPLQWERQP